MRQTIVINESLPGLNGKNGLLREHFRTRRKRTDKYQWLIMDQNLDTHSGPVHATITRYGCKEMDWDNVAASVKPVLDVMEKLGIIRDDSPSTIKPPFVLRQEKVRRRSEERTEITIIDQENDNA